ncbi:MAG TPA: hypothetical protein VMV49_08920, partial [Candidatus Deferrimicrobium sp.]|nr:hypothetical protein [Candidatus Deferrimicrobium sp.]
YKQTRGADIWALKQQVIDNCRKLKFPHVILTPTVVKGINDDQVTKIFDYAINNNDVVSTISFQPVALCGRMPQEEVLKMRYTSSHVIEALNQYTNGETGWMYPMPVLAKFAKVSSWINNNSDVLELTCNAICGYGTFVFIDPKTKKIRDITKLFDVPKFIRLTDKWYQRLLKRRQSGLKYRNIFNFGPLSRTVGTILDTGDETALKLQFAMELLTTLRNPFADGVNNFVQRAQLFLETMINSSRDSSANFLVKGNNLLIALMQFQDGYNMDMERASRCLVHYGYIDPKTQQVMAIPFCPMNTLHRPRIENELLMAQSITKEEPAELPIPEIHS